MNVDNTYSLTSKGQITIPKKLRDAIGLKPGGQAKIIQLDDRTVAIRAPLDVAEIRHKIGAPSGRQLLSKKEIERLAARGLV